MNASIYLLAYLTCFEEYRLPKMSCLDVERQPYHASVNSEGHYLEKCGGQVE